jgi:hypothetical protein
MGLSGLLPLRRRACCGLLWPLTIHRSRPGLNPRTLSPMASTITITLPRTTMRPYFSHRLNFSRAVFVISSITSATYSRGKSWTIIWVPKATLHEGAWGERRYSFYSFSTSALDWGERSTSRPGRALAPRERTPGTHCTGGWVGPTAGQRKNPLPLPGIEPRSSGRPARSQTL